MIPPILQRRLMMSSMSTRGFGSNPPAHPQSGNTGPVPSLDQPRPAYHGDTGNAGGVQGTMHDLAEGAGNVAGQVRDTARRWAGGAADAVEQGWEGTRQTIEGAWNEGTSFVRRHPVACMMGAFGAGALFASFLAVECASRYDRRYQ
jgi:hypothetical protein